MDMKTDHCEQLIGSLTYIVEERKIDKSLLYDTIRCLRELDDILSTYRTDYENNTSKGTARDKMWDNTIMAKQAESKSLLEKLRKL